jgi:hypothetical protein
MNQSAHPQAGRTASRAVCMLAAGLALVLAVPTSAAAADVLVSASVFGTFVDVYVPGQSGVTVDGSPELGTPYQDVVTPQKNTTAFFAVAGLIRTGQLTVSISGPPPGDIVAGETDAANVTVPTVFTASSVQGQCTASASTPTGSTTLANASVAGVPVPADPAPNTVINIPGVATVTLNKQSSDVPSGESADIDETAVYIDLPPGSPLGSGYISLGEMECDSLQTTDLPVGALGGVLLTVVLGVLFTVRQLRRRPA